MSKIILVAIAIIALAAPAAASAAGPWLDTPGAKALGPYRTDAQAARYLERTRGGSAFCLNGYYSKAEQRQRRHFRQRNDDRFASFACALSTDRGTAKLYLQTRPRDRWVVGPDR